MFQDILLFLKTIESHEHNPANFWKFEGRFIK
jgi:hypothetical protein